MRIVSWNCNGAFRKKLHAIEPFQADVLVIQECENPALSTRKFKDWAGDSFLWLGNSKNKGIGVFARNGHSVERLGWNDGGFQSFLPCTISNDFNLLAIWTKRGDSQATGYIVQLWQYFQLHKSRLSSSPMILCGDLNSSALWDKKRVWNHSKVVSELDEIGFKSLYHELTSEEQGKESRPTLFMHRKIERPYHIDYFFMPESAIENSKLTIGGPATWLELSDHMPLVCDVGEI